MNAGITSHLAPRTSWPLLAALAAAPLAAAPQGDPAPSIADPAIEVAIRADFRHDDAIPAHRIEVGAEDGIVTLSGTVDDLLARDRARELCERIRGVRAVVDTLVVQPAILRTDAEVAEAVEAALLRDPATEAYEIDCRVDRGRLTLSGQVDSHTERLLAVEVARGVRGVRSVDDDLEVRPSEDRLPTELADEIRRRLENDVWIDADGIEVAVDDQRRVRLDGEVGSAYEKRRARWLSWVVGVEDVATDALEVRWHARDWLERARPPLHRSDEEIRDAVLDALRIDPRVPSPQPLSVVVDEGTVTLHGRVDDAQTRSAAERDARSVAGVRRVRNHVRVRPPQVVADREIEAEVEQALRDTAAVDADQVEVEVDFGLVHLLGTVDSDWERTRAGIAARSADGVVAISNLLHVAYPRATYAEGELADECERRMEWSPFLDASDIAVSVDGSTLTLSGSVPSWRERLEAARCARLAGARKVVNRLLVRNDGGDRDS
jgi:osmotically-inducible protein OsmY